jgi:hypothetical protein
VIVVAPEGVDPDDDGWMDTVSDDEWVQAFVDAGFDQSYGELVVDALRGRLDVRLD